MPIDPSIALATRAPAIAPPLNVAGQATAIQGAQQNIALGKQQEAAQQLQLDAPKLMAQAILHTPTIDIGGGVQGYDPVGLSSYLTAHNRGDMVPQAVAYANAMNGATFQTWMNKLAVVRFGAGAVAMGGYDPALMRRIVNTTLRPLLGDKVADAALASKDPTELKRMVDTFLTPQELAAIGQASQSQSKAGMEKLQLQYMGGAPASGQGTAPTGDQGTAPGAAPGQPVAPAGTAPAPPATGAPGVPPVPVAGQTGAPPPTPEATPAAPAIGTPGAGTQPLPPYFSTLVNRLFPPGSKVLGDLNPLARGAIAAMLAAGPPYNVNTALSTVIDEAGRRGAAMNPTLIAAQVQKGVETAVGTYVGEAQAPLPVPSWTSDANAWKNPATANQPDPVLGVTPAALHQMALETITTGHVPSAGMGSNAKKIMISNAVMNQVGALTAQIGKDMPGLSMQAKADQAELTRLQTLHGGASAVRNGMGQMALLAGKLNPEIARTVAPYVNKPELWMKANLAGNPKLAQFRVYLYTLTRDYAKISSGSGASTQQLTDKAQAATEELLSAAQNPTQFSAALNGMLADTDKVLTGQQAELNATVGRISQLYHKAAAAKPGAGGPPVGTQRVINGTPAAWDGHGWLPVKGTP